MKHLDDQMIKWGSRLRDDLNLDINCSRSLATTISREVSELPVDVRGKLLISTPVPQQARLDELVAFQRFTEIVNSASGPVFVRANVSAQLYYCFVYLGDACFRILRKLAPKESALRKCCYFLTNNPVRALRNAVAHGNWCYRSDFTGITFWARKGDATDEPIVEWTVEQLDFDFWCALAKCTAYAVYEQLRADI